MTTEHTSDQIDTDQEEIDNTVDALENLFQSWANRFDEEELYQSSLFAKETFTREQDAWL